MPSGAEHGAVAGGRRDPGTGVRGDAAFRPRLQGGDERLLDGFFGEIEVPEDPDQGRDRSALLRTEQAIDGARGRGTYIDGRPSSS